MSSMCDDYWYGCLKTNEGLDYVVFDRNRQKGDLKKSVALFSFKKKMTIVFSVTEVRPRLRSLIPEEYYLKYYLSWGAQEDFYAELRKEDEDQQKKAKNAEDGSEDFEETVLDKDVDYADRIAEWAANNPSSGNEVGSIEAYIDKTSCYYDRIEDMDVYYK